MSPAARASLLLGAALLLIATARCAGPPPPAPAAPAPRAPASAAAPRAEPPGHLVLGGQGGVDMSLTDMAATPDGSVVAITCVTHQNEDRGKTPDSRRASIMRWGPDGTLEAQRELASPCTPARIALLDGGDVIVADASACREDGSPRDGGADGCVVVRRLDETLAKERFRVSPRLSHIKGLATGADDSIAVAGWRALPFNKVDTSITEIAIFDAQGERARTHVVEAAQTWISALAFTRDDVLVGGIVEGDLVVDGERRPMPFGRSMFLSRLGRDTRWTLAQSSLGADFPIHHPLKLALSARGEAIVLGALFNPEAKDLGEAFSAIRYRGGYDARFTLRVGLASGDVRGGAHAKLKGSTDPADVIVLPDGSVVVSEMDNSHPYPRNSRCSVGPPPRFTYKYEPQQATDIVRLTRLDATTLDPRAETIFKGCAVASGGRLAYAQAAGALFVGGTVQGMLSVTGGLIMTEEREEPCRKTGRRAPSPADKALFGMPPPPDPCTEPPTYGRALFVARVRFQ